MNVRPHLRLRKITNGAFADATAFDLNPEIVGLEHSTAVGAGFAGLRVGFTDPHRPSLGFLPDAIEIGDFYDVQLSHNGFTAFEGRVRSPDGTGTGVTALECDGYGVAGLTDAGYYASGGSGTTAGTILQNVLTLSCPFLTYTADASRFVDSGIAHSVAEFDGQLPSQIVQTLSSEGGASNDSDGAPYDFYVWDGRVAYWYPRIAPATIGGSTPRANGPRYWVDVGRAQLKTDNAKTCSTVVLKYQNTGSAGAASTVTVVDTDFINRYGFVRPFPMSGSQMSTAQATARARTYLALHRKPLMSITIRRSNWEGLELAGGGEQQPFLVRAGEYVQVGDQEPAIILGTTFNWSSGELELHAANYPPEYWAEEAKLEAVERAVSWQVSLQSGAPLTGVDGTLFNSNMTATATPLAASGLTADDINTALHSRGVFS